MRRNATLLAALALVIAGGTTSSVTRQASAAPGPRQATSATVRVDANHIVRRIDPRIYGVHFPAWNETAFVNGHLDPRLASDLDAAKFRTMVFPGGGYGYHYTWNRPNLPTEVTTDQFLSVARTYGATTRIDVNLNGTPELAAAWVRHAGHSVRYWEIGDEPYLNMSADAFIAKVRAFVPAMKRADPSIKIMLNISAEDPAFSQKVISEVGNLADVWSIHFFPLPPSKKFSASSPYDADHKDAFYHDLLVSPATFTEQLATVKQWVEAAYPDRHFEYDLGGWAPVTFAPEDWTVNALPDGLWAADMFGTVASDGLDSAAAWALMNPYPPGNGDFGYFSPTMKPYVIARAEQLYADHFGSLLVSSSSSAPSLHAFASLAADHRTLYVVLVNTDPDNAADTTFDISGFRPAGTAAAWVLDGPTNAAHLENYGLRREVLGNTDHWTVPAYSAVALQFPMSGGLGPAPNVAQDKYATASSTAFETDPVGGQQAYQFQPASAVDGLTDTRWAADYFEKKPAWYEVDLGEPQPFDRVELRWDYPSTAYTVEVSDDGTNWRSVASETTSAGSPQPVDEVRFDSVTARYVRISMTGRPAAEGAAAGASQWTPEAFSLWEVGVYLD